VEKELVRSGYENMPAADEPPFPREGLRPLYQIIRKAQSSLQVNGSIHLIATVDASGDVKEIEARGALDKEMANIVQSAVMLTKFKPGICAGKACVMQYRFDLDFTTEL
jgi:hypothetical protein